MALLVFIATGVLLVAILLWGIGSGLARLVGIILFIDGIGGMFIRGGDLANTRFPIEAGIGLALWLAGHWLYALKHRLWRSHLALVVWRLPILSLLAPIPTR